MPKFKASEGFKMPGAPFMKKPVNTKDLGEDVTNDPRYKKAKDSGKKVYKSKTGQITTVEGVPEKDQSAPEYRSNIDEID